MTKEERDILIRIDQKVTDMSESCARHSEQIKELYDKANGNSQNIARIMGVGAACVLFLSILVALVK